MRSLVFSLFLLLGLLSIIVCDLIDKMTPPTSITTIRKHDRKQGTTSPYHNKIHDNYYNRFKTSNV